MGNVSIVSCDGCGKEARVRDGWIQLAARSKAFTQMDIGILGGAYAGVGALVTVRGAHNTEAEGLDFCSPACAGAALFGRRLAPPVIAPPVTSGGLT